MLRVLLLLLLRDLVVCLLLLVLAGMLLLLMRVGCMVGHIPRTWPAAVLCPIILHRAVGSGGRCRRCRRLQACFCLPLPLLYGSVAADCRFPGGISSAGRLLLLGSACSLLLLLMLMLLQAHPSLPAAPWLVLVVLLLLMRLPWPPLRLLLLPMLLCLLPLLLMALAPPLCCSTQLVPALLACPLQRPARLAARAGAAGAVPCVQHGCGMGWGHIPHGHGRALGVGGPPRAVALQGQRRRDAHARQQRPKHHVACARYQGCCAVAAHRCMRLGMAGDLRSSSTHDWSAGSAVPCDVGCGHLPHP